MTSCKWRLGSKRMNSNAPSNGSTWHCCYRCSDRQTVDLITPRSDADYARIIDSNPSLIMLAHSGHLMSTRPGFSVIHANAFVGAGLDARNRGFVREIETGRGYDALFGSNLHVVRLRLNWMQ